MADSRRVVLVVDDDQALREMLCVALEAEGYAAVGAKNGRDALARLQAMGDPQTVNLVLLDLMMPVMSGHDFLERRRLDPRLSAIPVVIMSAILDDARTYPFPFVRKPPDLDTLLAFVRSACDQA